MQEQYAVFTENRDDINTFMIETISNLGSLSELESSNFKKLFKVFPSLGLVYICDKNSKNLEQISENIHRKKIKNQAQGRSRKYLLKKIKIGDSNISVSKPYISSATGKTCVTVAVIENEKIYFLDFNLSILLQRLGLLEMHQMFTLSTKAFYAVIGIAMMALALFALGYSSYEFYDRVFVHNILSIESIFKPVIALTLGLAIFDLSKTVLEQEVIFKSHSKNNQNEYRILTKFSVTIVVALLIEALMVVFKIAIEDYSNMIQALYLIIGVSLLMVSLAFFIRTSKL